ncbi:MAG: cytochrome-c oxidase, cbb3-type subunit III [Nitratireductor sp.]|uniref:cytochrome-c oxidase, cbb3-type subunit III n=1 Tax=Hyphomicrobiales TaxID=356 RepID=UPI00260E8F75|nr:cytochrome-c oxidase, cbb3-type subunit III [Nitratireductor sp.]MCV0352845.1 cytochrome-c oxidase, cbb3-type subunit III [Nitratireductor sp.]
MSKHSHREIDPVTGHETTGHDWNGIKELNTPLPKIVIWALILTFVYSVIAWILLPAWPIGRDYTRGLLGLDQSDIALEDYRALATKRQDWLQPFENVDFSALQADDVWQNNALPAAQRLFEDNCAVCHGLEGRGIQGFPVLSDETWLWSDTPEEIAQTIRYGINANSADTRYAEMPSFNWMERPDRVALAEYVVSLGDGSAKPNAAAATLFSENCAACHGEAGVGGLENGAPALNDSSVIYGQDFSTVMRTLWSGRQGVMPAWTDRLTKAEINLLAFYVSRLGADEEQVAQ